MSAHTSDSSKEGVLPQSAGAAKKIRVWVVDDDVRYREPCVRLLERHFGFDCERQFGLAEDMVAALRLDAPDVILLDFGLPGMSGLQALTHVRAISPATPVLMFSALMDIAKEREALRGGARAVFSKSEPAETIVALIHSAGEQAKQSRLGPREGGANE